jgi:hypothetical protein
MKARRIYTVAIALASACNAAEIALPNPSFESPDFADGSGEAYVESGLVFGWNFTGPGQFGIGDPNGFRFHGTTGNATLLPTPADGYQYAVLGGAARSVTSIQNPAPLGTIQPLTQYTLDIAAINLDARNFGSGLGTLQISLLAGMNSMASSSLDYSSFNFGEIRPLQVSFMTGASDWTVGQALNIRVSVTAPSNSGANGFFDNLVLTATPVPEPSLVAIGLLAVFGFTAFRFHRKQK